MTDNTAKIRRLIVKIFGSQLACARALGFSDRQVRYWCSSGAPPHVELALTRLQDGVVNIRGARRILRTKRGRRVIHKRR
jgi:hypothetical protein